MRILANQYQFFRELLFALEKGSVFVLLSDDRNPAYHSSGPQGERGLMPFLTDLLPADIQNRVASISIQDLIAEVSISGKHNWTVDFMEKYAMLR